MDTLIIGYIMSVFEIVNSDIGVLLRDRAKSVDSVLKKILDEQTQIDSTLKQAMCYSLFAPGKRIRSALVLWCCEVVSGRINRDAEIAAAVIEMVHTYSLIHDDLPAMDDDNFRRGQPTCHKAFNEATAILAGDGLLTFAFKILATQISDPTLAVRLIDQLADAAGPAGMIAGQIADLNAEKTSPDIETLENIHTNKTAKMFRCAAAMGAICAGANESKFIDLTEYGLKVGLSFQIADDILDISASSERLGKTAGKDAKMGKATYPVIVGINKSKQIVEKLSREAVMALEQFGKEADILRKLAIALVERKK
jgi:geranylgeranyl diphosphate synthase type II